MAPRLHSIRGTIAHPANDLVTEVDIDLAEKLEFEIVAIRDKVAHLEFDSPKVDIDYDVDSKVTKVKGKHALPNLFRGTKLVATQTYKNHKFNVVPKPALKAVTSFTARDGITVGHNLTSNVTNAGGIYKIGGKKQATVGAKVSTKGDVTGKLKYRTGAKYCDMVTLGWFKDIGQTISAHAFPWDGYKLKTKWSTAANTLGSYVKKDVKGAGAEWKVGVTAPVDGKKEKLSGVLSYKWKG